MNKNALMFNLHVENKNSMHYYSMLYYALETLEKFYDENNERPKRKSINIDQKILAEWLHRQQQNAKNRTKRKFNDKWILGSIL